MVLHRSLTGLDLHDPKGVSPWPLVLPPATASAYRIEDDSGAVYFRIDSSSGAEEIFLGSATLQTPITFAWSPNVPDLFLRSRASDPTLPSGQSAVYTKSVSTVLELFYRDSAGNVVQLTSGGLSAGGGTLDAAYDYGGAHLGRTINIDTGFPVVLTSAGSANAALEITGYLHFAHTDTTVGGGTHATIGANATLVGHTSRGADNSVVLGYAGNASGANAVVVGAQGTAHASSIVFGRTAASSASNQAILGASAYYVTECVIGGGVSDNNARQLLLRPSNASSTARGWDLILSAGLGATSSGGGVIALATSDTTTVGTRFHVFEHDPEDAYGPHLAFKSDGSAEPLRHAQVSIATTTATGSILSFDFSGITVATWGWAIAKVSGVNVSSEHNAYQLMTKFRVSSAGAVTVPTAAGSQVIWADEDNTPMTVSWGSSGGGLDLEFDTGGAAADWKWHVSVEFQLGT